MSNDTCAFVVDHNLTRRELFDSLLGTILVEGLDEELVKALSNIETKGREVAPEIGDTRKFLGVSLKRALTYLALAVTPLALKHMPKDTRVYLIAFDLRLLLLEMLRLKPRFLAEQLDLEYVDLDLSISQALDRVSKKAYDEAYQHTVASVYRSIGRQIDNALDEVIGDEDFTPQKMASAFDYKKVDVDRLTATEIRYAINAEVISSSDKVWFHVQPDACIQCKRLYLDKNGNPIVFTSKQIKDNTNLMGGYNHGPRSAWKALPVIHPWCRCRAMRGVPYINTSHISSNKDF